ncbi:MAG: hypothetical protein U9R79_04600 [Armatimonadota bacterium]|nr:hypothetical protein [Armatimonadota bacterium]
MRLIGLLTVIMLVIAATCVAQDEERHPGWEPEPGDLDPERNIALGKTVTYAPLPNYRLTREGDTDPTDLTDGELSDHHRGHLWFQSKCVGWSYGGRANLAVDLGAVEPIDEIAIRIQGGSPQAGICTPVWMEALVSDDGEVYRRVGEFSTFRRGDLERFGVPPHAGEAWVHRFRFSDLATRGRYVGLRLYGAGLTVADEMYVFRGEHDPGACDMAALPVTDFSVKRPQMYLHKPYLCFLTNLAAPNPVGMVVPPGFEEQGVVVTLELPPGVELVGGGGFGMAEDATPLSEIGGRQIADDWTRYEWQGSAAASTKTWGRLFITGDWEDGREGELRYRLTYADGSQGPLVSVPLRAMEVPPTPQPERLVTGLSWYNFTSIMQWPGGLDDFAALGMNTITGFIHWLRDVEEHQEAWDFWERARDRGFKLLNIDSTFHRMHRDDEIYCQLEDGEVSSRICPSYRGQYYQQEIERVARQCAMARPHYLFCDIEIWNWQGPTDAEKCTRCQADFAQSGLDTWEEWKLQKGYEMWTDVVQAVRAAVEEAGGPEMEFGVYDWRAGHNYQFTWPFDRLYPEYLQSSQPSTYTPLYWSHLMLVGDEARVDREQLPGPDVMPWISPGDAGTFDGERFRYALLECFCNGSRGMNFWSGRVWDAETLAAYARVIRNLAPVEDLLLDGELLEGAQVHGPGRISGVVSGDEMVILVADYLREGDGSVTVTLPVNAAMTATDLDTGEALQVSADGRLTVPLGDERARILHVTP